MARPHRKTRAHADRQQEPRKPTPAPVRDLEAIFQRKDQAAIYRELVERHRGEIPVRVLVECRAIRLGGAA